MWVTSRNSGTITYRCISTVHIASCCYRTAARNAPKFVFFYLQSFRSTAEQIKILKFILFFTKHFCPGVENALDCRLSCFYLFRVFVSFNATIRICYYRSQYFVPVITVVSAEHEYRNSWGELLIERSLWENLAQREQSSATTNWGLENIEHTRTEALIQECFLRVKNQ